MIEGELIPGASYKYHFDERIDRQVIDRMVTLWNEVWAGIPDEALQKCRSYLRRIGCESRAILVFFSRDDTSLRGFARSLRDDYVFAFKPQVLGLFSDNNVKAMFSHELAHLYLKSQRDKYHVFPPINRQEMLECETNVDSCASWGFRIDEARAEEAQLMSEYPGLFGQPIGMDTKQGEG